MIKRKWQRKGTAITLMFLCALSLLIITNVSPSEAVKLNKEKAWLEGLDVGDYFEIGEHPETFFLVHYTDPGKGGVVFYNFNFEASDFDPKKEDVIAILDHFGLTESLNWKTRTISLKTLTSSQTCHFHALFEFGDFQRLKKPEWFEERWQSN